MTAIDGLLRKAGEINGAGLKCFSPALVELAAIQASLAEALTPFYDAVAVSEMKPFRYDFVIPAEPPEIKAEPAEPHHEAGRAEVSIGPINVNAVVKEIEKAVECIGHESSNIAAAYTTYTAPDALPAARAQAVERPAAFNQHAEPVIREPSAGPRAAERPPAGVVKREQARAVPSEEWVEKSVRRSSVVMSDLNEVHRNILKNTITIDDVHHMSPDASAIGTMARFEPPQNLAEKPVEASIQRPVMPERKPDHAVKAVLPQKVVEVPPIRPRPKPAPPEEEATYNARRLSEALTRSAESARPPAFPDNEKHEAPAKAEWPVAPVQAAREHAAVTPAVSIREAPSFMLSSPTAGVARSFGAMGEYMRAVTAAVSGITPGGDTTSQGVGRALFDAMSRAPMPGEPMFSPIDNVPSSAMRTSARASLPPGEPYSPQARPGMGLPASIAALQAGRSPGISMIQQLIRSAPVVPGSAAPQAPAMIRDGMSWTPPASPISASGGESIVNVTVPPATQGTMGDNSTTNKVSNFHNTFNITVNVKSGEEKDLKELGRKIGQILSDEMKRYGGLS